MNVAFIFFLFERKFERVLPLIFYGYFLKPKGKSNPAFWVWALFYVFGIDLFFSMNFYVVVFEGFSTFTTFLFYLVWGSPPKISIGSKFYYLGLNLNPDSSNIFVFLYFLGDFSVRLFVRCFYAFWSLKISSFCVDYLLIFSVLNSFFGVVLNCCVSSLRLIFIDSFFLLATDWCPL